MLKPEPEACSTVESQGLPSLSLTKQLRPLGTVEKSSRKNYPRTHTHTHLLLARSLSQPGLKATLGAVTLLFAGFSCSTVFPALPLTSFLRPRQVSGSILHT